MLRINQKHRLLDFLEDKFGYCYLKFREAPDSSLVEFVTQKHVDIIKASQHSFKGNIQ